MSLLLQSVARAARVERERASSILLSLSEVGVFSLASSLVTVEFSLFLTLPLSLFFFVPLDFLQNSEDLMAASRAQGASLASRLRAFVDSPTGLKTTHFWGPVANWGFVLAVSELLWWNRNRERRARASSSLFFVFCALKKKVDGPILLTVSSLFLSLSPTLGSANQGLADSQKPAELISPNMTGGETF